MRASRADIEMIQPTAPSALIEENALLREEVRVARRASELTAKLVVEQFVKIEKMLQRIVDSESRFRDLYQESNQREQIYLSLLNSTPDAVIIFDLREIPTYVNPAFVRMFGFEPAAIAQPGFPWFAPEERERMSELFRDAVAGTPISGWESKVLSGPGQTLDVTVSASCYKNPEGLPTGVMAILQNITPRKLAERVLRRERETFFKILDKAPYGVALLDQDGRLLHANAELLRIIGYSSQDIRDLDHWFQLVYPDPEQRRAAVRAWQGGGHGGNRVFEITCRDGGCKLVEFRRTLLPNEGEVVTISDVTEQERIQQQVRRAKEEWERTFDAIEDILTIQDQDLRLVRVNLAAARALNAEPQDLIGRECYRLFSNEGKPCRHCPGLKTLEDHLPHSAEIRHDRSGRTFSVTTWPIFTQAGGFTGIVHAAKDITEKRQMEDELLKAQKLESIGILAGGIAHDFNNILTAILGNISLARMVAGASNDTLAKRLDNAEKATTAARELTQQLLTFAKGGAPILKTESIGDCIRDSVSFVIRGANVLVEYHIADDLWAVEADKSQLTQVINNLVINAIQAMPKGGVVRVTAVNRSAPQPGSLPQITGPHVEITISDQGIGIEPQHLTKIFDPYFTTKTGGSGLGLATAFSIVKRHQGALTVESTVGVGTVFHIYLPASDREIRPQLGEPMEESRTNGKGRVLVMDDEALIRDIAGEMLEFIGYSVDLAATGEEALERYLEARERGAPFDAVIMDLTIPGGMGGEEAIGRLLEVDPNARAIVSSGYSNDPVMRDFRRYGFRGVVTKPYKIKELTVTLSQVLTADH